MKTLIFPNETGPFVIAEIGINHNGNLSLAKRLIDAAALAGADAVKFQKRTIDVVYTPAELAASRESPFGTTNGDLKRGLEFNAEQYTELAAYCAERNLHWTASCWDEASVDVIHECQPSFWKIASASLTDHNLLRHTRAAASDQFVILSTGMSTIEEIDAAVEVLGRDKLVLLHCQSTYPSAINELNLRGITTLQERYNVPVGYSGHEVGLATTVAAVALGACVLERHITLDRAMWGSDQAASVEPDGFRRLVKDAHSVYNAMGDGHIIRTESEEPVRKKLRRVG